jgi:hypothetical protein
MRSSLSPVATPEPGEAVPLAPATRDLLIVGCGVLGSRVADGAVRAGYSVGLCDFDTGTTANVPRQLGIAVGEPKALALAERLNELRPGAATAYVADMRALEVGILRHYRLLLDCSDDPELIRFLALVGNGLRLPVVRAALDGSGQRALGRVRASQAGRGRSCPACHSAPSKRSRTPCPGAAPESSRPATRAGIPIAMTIAGLALHVAGQILAGRVDVLGRETYLDLEGATLTGAIPLDGRCPVGHEPWGLEELRLEPAETSLAGLFAHLASVLGGGPVVLEPFANPAAPSTRCLACGAASVDPGLLRTPSSPCACGGRTERRPELALPALTEAAARTLGLSDKSLAALGLRAGALLLARAGAGGTRHFLLSTLTST